jgi:hypothetical protein
VKDVFCWGLFNFFGNLKNDVKALQVYFKAKKNYITPVINFFFFYLKKPHFPESALCGSRWGSKTPTTPVINPNDKR